MRARVKTQARRGLRHHLNLTSEAQRGEETCPRSQSSEQQQCRGLLSGSWAPLPTGLSSKEQPPWMNRGNRQCAYKARAVGDHG